MTITKTLGESAVRRRALRRGYVLRKDRARTWSANHRGGYMLIDAARNVIVAGADFDLDLEDVMTWLDERAL